MIRPATPLLKELQEFLTAMDVCAAKAKYARELNALLPEINKGRQLYLRDAYHPLLYLTNLREGGKTWPQTIDLNTENRIMVISR